MSVLSLLFAFSLCVSGLSISLREDVKPRLVIVSSQYGTKSGGSLYTSRGVTLPPLAEGVLGFFFTDLTDVKETNGWKVVSRTYHLDVGQPWSVLDTHSGYSPTANGKEAVRGIMAARFYKMNSHLLPELQGADMIFWTDSSTIAIAGASGSLGRNGIGKPDIAERAAALLGNDDAVLEWHEYRRKVTDEIGPAGARALAETGLGNAEHLMREGYKVMLNEGFKDDAGLYKSEQFLYRARSPAMKAMMAYWWTFSQTYSFRDQIGMPWALKKNSVKFKVPCAGRGGSAYSCVLTTIVGTKP